MLIDGTVDVPPDTGDLDIPLVNKPAVTNQMPARPSGFGEHRCEPLHPPEQGHVVDFDATFREEFFEVAVGQVVAQVPAHRQQNHIRREPETNERRGRNSRRTSHPAIVR